VFIGLAWALSSVRGRGPAPRAPDLGVLVSSALILVGVVFNATRSSCSRRRWVAAFDEHTGRQCMLLSGCTGSRTGVNNVLGTLATSFWLVGLALAVLPAGSGTGCARSTAGSSWP